MKGDICLPDHHQGSHYDTITIGPEGNDQLGSTVEQQPVGKLVQQSFGEVQRVKFSKPTCGAKQVKHTHSERTICSCRTS